MQQPISAPILKNTYSASDLYRRADMLQHFLEDSFFKTASKSGSRAELITTYYAQSDAETVNHAAAIAAWGSAVLDEYTADNLYERIRTLKLAVKSFPKLTLYVPVRLAAAQIERIGGWCRSQIQPDIMLDLKIDADTVGGCAFAYQNTFHDLSFSYFSHKERAAVLSLVQTV